MRPTKLEIPGTQESPSLLSGLPTQIASVALEPGGARIVDASQRFLDTLNLPRAAVVGRLIAEVFNTETGLSLEGVLKNPAPDRPRRVRVLQREGPEVKRYDLVAHADEASPLQAYLTVEPVQRVRTLTEARRAELFDRVGPLSPGLIYMYDMVQGRTRYLHKSLAEMLGAKRGLVELDKIEAHLHPDDRIHLRDHLVEVRDLADDQVAMMTVRLKNSAGDWAWLQARSRVFTRRRNGEPGLIIGAAADISDQRRLTKALSDASEALVQAESAERRRIGRELHDSTAQHLVAIDLSLATLERRAAFTASEQVVLGDIRTSLASAHREVRTFAYMLHPPQLEQRGLEATLQAFAAGFGRRTGLEIGLEITGLRRILAPGLELALFRIAQEALMNVHRHAKATTASVRLHQARTLVSLEVEDDGVGLSEVDLQDVDQIGVGVSGMRARMNQLGGELVLTSGASGLKVRAAAPVEA